MRMLKVSAVLAALPLVADKLAALSLHAAVANDTTARLSSGEVTPVPEPATYILVGLGLLLTGGLIRKRMRG